MSKKTEFREFLKSIEEHQFAHWENIAQAIGVSRATIDRWRQLPEAKNAITMGIAKTLQQMENAGRKDWRMWEAKLKMLGVNPAQKHEIDTGDKINEILNKYGGGKGDVTELGEAQD